MKNIEALREHNSDISIQAIAQEKFVQQTRQILDSHPPATTLRTHLKFLQKSRDRYQFRLNKIRKSKKAADVHKANEALVYIAAIDEAIPMVSSYLVKTFADMGIPGGAAYAYGPREGVHYDIHTPGRDHFQLALPLVHGRLVRQMGDLMCRPSRELWGLRITNDPTLISCRACLKRMLHILEAEQARLPYGEVEEDIMPAT
jgi:hypothetical protein